MPSAPLVACAFCGRPLSDANCPDECTCWPQVPIIRGDLSDDQRDAAAEAYERDA